MLTGRDPDYKRYHTADFKFDVTLKGDDFHRSWTASGAEEGHWDKNLSNVFDEHTTHNGIFKSGEYFMKVTPQHWHADIDPLL